MVNDTIKCKAIVKKIIYYNNTFGIVSCSPTEIVEGEPYLSWGEFTLKGDMAYPQEGREYTIVATEVEDGKYGTQYEVKYMGVELNLDTEDDKSKRQFLLTVFTELQVENMYNALSDPFMALKNKDAASLVQVKGCGAITADAWIKKFENEIKLYEFYKELFKYNFTYAKIIAIKNHYDNNIELVKQILETNPYILMEVTGFGWKTVDKIALDMGWDKYGKERISGFIEYFLESQAQEGNSYIDTQVLMQGIIDNLETEGNVIPDICISDAIHYIENDLWWNEEKTLIGLKRYYKLEQSIAKELIRIRDSELLSTNVDWKEKIKQLELEQNWEYTDEQKYAVKKITESNLLLIHGLAGTGKSSTVQAILSVFPNATIAQTALSGRAASRMTEITSQTGYTIHRLLGAIPSMGTKEIQEEDGSIIKYKQSFTYHDENRLDYDIIILDEISMVDGALFYYLIRSIKDGAKLIILGDGGQLSSIGSCNIAADLINSPEIPTVELTQIHRQAKASGIISESIKVRKGIQIIDKDWVGKDVRGNLKDFSLECYSDKSNTYYKIMQEFSRLFELIKDGNLIQVLVPMKNRGGACVYNINKAIQALVNPIESNKPNITIYTDGQPITLQVGDRIINNKNNYKTTDINGQTTPIFNGQIGYITSIQSKEITVDFGYETGRVVIPTNMLNDINLGYCITIHKSQGSQFDYVIVGIDNDAFPLLCREVIYTAVTRASKQCYMVAQNKALRYATVNEKVVHKQTFLLEQLNEIAHPKLIF